MHRDIRIGIITLSASDNCGSLLQAFALKQILSQYGDVSIIPFTSKKSKEVYSLLRNQKVWRTFVYDRARVKVLPSLFMEKFYYQRFRRKELGFKGSSVDATKLSEMGDSFDVVVVGSDQVWNVAMWDFDNAFFLGWVSPTCKKMAYAPSLGGHSLEEAENVRNIAKWLNDFDAISCREHIGARNVESFLKKYIKKDSKIETVLDPTLLLSREQWEEMIGSPYIKGDYFFYYSWAYNDAELLQIVCGEGEKCNTPVVVIDARKWVYQEPDKNGFQLCKKGGAYAFLNLMFYAKRCYVESFHGTIFAYLFKRNFWLLDIHKDSEKMDARLKDLVQLLNIENRVLTTENYMNIDPNMVVDYTDADKLNDMRVASFNYLDSFFDRLDLK